MTGFMMYFTAIDPSLVANGLNSGNVSLDALVEKGTSLGVEFVSRLLVAVLIYVLGAWMIRILKRAFKILMEKRDVDLSLRTFLYSLASIGLNFILIVSIIGVLGVEMTSFVALFASAGIAIGMALSGTLQNFANGVFILLLKPYRVGDFIEVQQVMGTVKAIQITSTLLTTPDNRTIIIPNGVLLSGTIINYSQQKFRRVDWVFSIVYGDDYEKARKLLLDLIADESRILSEPDAPAIWLGALGQSSVDVFVRVWVNAQDYWPVLFSMNEKVYKSFPEHGLSIPFPQMDVHVHQV